MPGFTLFWQHKTKQHGLNLETLRQESTLATNTTIFCMQSASPTHLIPQGLDPTAVACIIGHCLGSTMTDHPQAPHSAMAGTQRNILAVSPLPTPSGHTVGRRHKGLYGRREASPAQSLFCSLLLAMPRRGAVKRRASGSHCTCCWPLWYLTSSWKSHLHPALAGVDGVVGVLRW